MNSANQIKKVLYFYSKIQQKIFAIPDYIFFLVAFIGITMYWFPAYKALFPGTFGYDGPVQIAQYFGEYELSTHHPLAHTFLMGLCFSLGKACFGNYTLGFIFYITLQGLIVVFSLTSLFLTVKRLNLNLVLSFVGFLFVIRNPMIQAITFSSTKDVLFGAFLLLFSSTLVEQSYNSNKRSYIKLVLYGILLCLFRNQGIYILIAILITATLFHLTNRNSLVCFIGIICFILFFNFIASQGLHIKKGDSREMLSVPIQQETYVVSRHLGELSPQQLDLFFEVIPSNGYTAYCYNSADNIKSLFVTDALADNWISHLLNYIRLGIKYPEDYLYAWKGLIEGYFNTDLMEYRGLSMTYTFDDLNHFGIKHAHLDDAYHLGLWLATQFSKTPLHFRPELSIYCLLIASLLAILKRNKNSILIALVYIFYLGTILLGPVALIRYLYPITIATPLFLCLPFYKQKREE